VSAEAPTVIQIYEPEIGNTIPFAGCVGASVTTGFVGWLRATMIVCAEGATNVEFETGEDATRHRHGVGYTAKVRFDPPAQGG
jgi:hypothetical protein